MNWLCLEPTEEVWTSEWPLFKGTADRVGSLGGTLFDELKETKVEETRKTKVQKESRGKAEDAQERE